MRRNLELKNVENYLEEQKVGAHLGDVSTLNALLSVVVGTCRTVDEYFAFLPDITQIS